MNDESNKTDESALFMARMAGVEPLKSDNRIKFNKTPKKPLLPTVDDNLKFSIEDNFSDAEIIENCPEVLSFSRSGLQHNVLKKLRQGRYPIEHTLDLHGLTVAEASKALLVFFNECEATGTRHAIIIHGKGFRSKDKPVIKPMVNRWLRA
ncbi:MAG: Smr/MutS family protein, partial [Gammaproteobacteria bacterium]|nr:Smr/MutS family protein [Gammaproteobacteria bacterium]